MPAVWDNKNFVTVYQLASAGVTLAKTAEVLGVSEPTLKKWRDTVDGVQDAIEPREGQVQGDRGGNVRESGRTATPRWTPLIEKIGAVPPTVTRPRNANASRQGPREAAGRRGRGPSGRKVYLEILYRTNFKRDAGHAGGGRHGPNAERVAQAAGVLEARGKDALGPGESLRIGPDATHQRGPSRTPAATIFANKTYNANRGYGKIEEEKDEDAASSDFAQIVAMLTIEARKEVLAAIDVLRSKKTIADAPGDSEEFIEAEYTLKRIRNDEE